MKKEMLAYYEEAGVESARSQYSYLRAYARLCCILNDEDYSSSEKIDAALAYIQGFNRASGQERGERSGGEQYKVREKEGLCRALPGGRPG